MNSAAKNSSTTSKQDDLQYASKFLQEQARQARQSMSVTITDLKTDLVHSIDPRPWFKHHPKLCTGICIAGAATVGAALLKALVRKNTQPEINVVHSHCRSCHTEQSENKPSRAEKIVGHAQTFFGTDMGRTVKNMLINAVMAKMMVSGQSNSPDNTEAQYDANENASVV